MTDDWLNVYRVWHELGGRGTATMMFGHVETLAERIEHFERPRQLQDETGGFTAFICWTFQPEHTDMAQVPAAGSFEYLKSQAVSRLYPDNFPNIQSSWVTQGLKIGQLALRLAPRHGQLDDRGKRRLSRRHGAPSHVGRICGAIRRMGYTPRRRNVFYELVDVRRDKRQIPASHLATGESGLGRHIAYQPVEKGTGSERPRHFVAEFLFAEVPVPFFNALLSQSRRVCPDFVNAAEQMGLSLPRRFSDRLIS